MPKSFLDYPNYPRGLRNNNPGNLIYTGDQWQGMIGVDSGGFVIFENIAWGIRAMGKDVIHDINAGTNTIQALIYEYAPPSQNNTEAYINAVVAYSGISRTQRLQPTRSTLKKLMRAMMNVELGTGYSALITDADIYEGIDMIGGAVQADSYQPEGILLLGGAIALALAVK